MTLNLRTLVTLLLLLVVAGVYAQAPNISYGSTKITTGVPVSLKPVNTGGAVPATVYGATSEFAGSATGTAGYLDGSDTSANFNFPQQMIMDAAGNLYVTDAANNVIRKITPAGAVTTFAGDLTGLRGFKDSTGNGALFNYPDGIAIDGSGNLFVSDYNNNAIRKVTPAGVVTTFYVSQGTFGPDGICFDGSGNLLVACQDANQIVSISPAGVASVVAGNGTAGYVNGPASSAEFNYLTDVRVDPSGNIMVADAYNNAIRMLSPSGVVSTFAGTTLPGSTNDDESGGYANGKGTQALFSVPTGFAYGSGGVLYVADWFNNDIRRIMPDGTVGLAAGSPTQVSGFNDGTGTSASFNLPDYIYIDPTGVGYVAEFERIRKIVLTGYSLTGTLPAGLSFDPATGIISGTPTGTLTPMTDTITAYNTSGYSTTIITIPPSSNASLTNLVPSAGKLSPAFATGTLSYTASLANGAARIAFTPTTSDGNAIVTVNAIPVTSGTLSANIPLSVGTNTIKVVVTAQDSSTSLTYTITVTRAPSSNANLVSLKLNHGSLSPSFAPGTTSYTTSIANGVTSITITPTDVDTTATLLVNGTALPSGTASSAIPLAVGANIIRVQVTAQDGTIKKTYTVTITRAPSSNANLVSLKLNHGALSPSFAPGTTSYTASVANGVSSVIVTPTAVDTTATLLLNGNSIASGAASNAIPLVVGANTIQVQVTAQDGTTKNTYTIAINRAPSSNDKLLSLKLSRGTLSPAFSPATTSGYTVSVVNGVSSLTITPTSVDTTATLLINNVTPIASGATSSPIPLAVGANTISVKVTAADGSNQYYTVTVTRAAGSNDQYTPIANGAGISVTKPEETITLAEDGIVVHQALSPNGDGINDFLTIDNIGQYPDNKLMIMNRNGQLIYEAGGYDNSSKVFDGHSNKNGQMQLPGTYFYQLDYTVKGITKTKTGFLVLKY